ncbi:unnamed protein product, partial [Prunus brigantina]
SLHHRSATTTTLSLLANYASSHKEEDQEHLQNHILPLPLCFLLYPNMNPNFVSLRILSAT